MLDDLRRLLLRPEGVRLVGVTGGQQPGRRVGGPGVFPAFEPLKIEDGLRPLRRRREASALRRNPVPVFGAGGAYGGAAAGLVAGVFGRKKVLVYESE